MTSIFRRYFAFFCLFVLCGITNSYANGLPDFTELVEQNKGAVVNISTTQTLKNIHSSLPPGIELPEGSPYSDLFKRFFGMPPGQRPQSREARSLGSGFIISENGYLLTNRHVVKDADEIIVRFQDRRELKATLVGSDERTDVALLKVSAHDLPVVKLGAVNDLKVGEWVVAIGSPFGFESTVTAGIVSAKGRSLPSENYVPFIQTDVAINPGNSGGPLFNLAGEVVGINSQIYSRSGGFMGLSFAIPINVAMNVSEQIKKTGHVVRGWLGVSIQDVTRELAESFGMIKPHGALIAHVIKDSPAQKAGLVPGDVIVKFNGQTVDRSSALPPLVGSANMTKKATVTIIRHKKKKIITVKLERLPEDKHLLSSNDNEPQGEVVLGMLVKNLTISERKEIQLEKRGILVSSLEGGSASKAGVYVGDIILQIDGKAIDDIEQFKKIVDKITVGKYVSMLINRDGNSIFIALKK